MNNILRNKEFKCGLEKSQAMPKIRMTLGQSIAIRITAKAYMWECKKTTPERIWPNCDSALNADSNFPFKNSLKILGLATN